MADAADAWRGDHPWAGIYDFFVQRGQLSRGLGWLVWGTDVRRLYRSAGAIGSMPRGTAILDIPCGGGVAFRGLRPEQDVRYVAADVSPAMLERARREAVRRGLEQIEYVEADVAALPFADGEFDLCVSFTGLHCFDDPQAAVAELARCLAPGGRLVGSGLLTGSLRYEPMIVLGRIGGLMGPGGSADDVKRWLAAAGLEDVALERSGALGYFSARRPKRAARSSARRSTSPRSGRSAR
ncbi:MAG TPA: class I SAM-dependent methyltransferase [Solirubrobacteraceae bacterium]|nr:class I SAM-dependent methyltransferase [Solirubrobacteraceae bacterium]